MWTGSRDWLPVNWCINHHVVVVAVIVAIVVVQSLSRIQLFATPWIAARWVSLSFPFFPDFAQFMSTELVMLSNHLILCPPLVLLPSIFPGIFGPFPNASALHIRWPKYWSFSFSICHSNKYSRLRSFRIDWFDLLAVQRTLNSLLQHHSLKASVLWYSAFYMIQLSHLCLTIRKTIALTIWTFVSKVMSLLFNTLSRYVTAFLPRSKRLLISWLLSPSTVILEAKKKEPFNR